MLSESLSHDVGRLCALRVCPPRRPLLGRRCPRSDAELDKFGDVKAAHWPQAQLQLNARSHIRFDLADAAGAAEAEGELLLCHQNKAGCHLLGLCHHRAERLRPPLAPLPWRLGGQRQCHPRAVGDAQGAIVNERPGDREACESTARGMAFLRGHTPPPSETQGSTGSSL